MTLYPDVLKKVQAELDAVVGPHRLLDFGDRESLVYYVNAIVKESLRWQNVAPLAIPHLTTADDVLDGYFIPGSTLVIQCVSMVGALTMWTFRACMHDSEEYKDPDDFRPERFIKDGRLDPRVRDPFAFAFGFGRRVCPGRYFADASLFINIASVLHVFDITPPVDEHGNTIKVVPQMSDGILSYPTSGAR